MMIHGATLPDVAVADRPPARCPADQARRRRRWQPAAALLAISGALLLASPAQGHESDQLTVPERDQMVDLGYYFTQTTHSVLERVVERANKNIARALKIRDAQMREQSLRRYHDPGYLADQVRGFYGPGFFEPLHIQSALWSDQARKNFPGKILAYVPKHWVYDKVHLPIDPRKIVLMFKSSSVLVYGSYVGTDKFGHFHDLGHIYYKSWLSLRKGGMSEEKATAQVVKTFSNGIISEGAIIGSLATGVHSNADLAANFVGMRFYQNLTEPVTLKGQLQPPLLVRDGDYWQLNTHVRPDSDFFAVYISDHLNEALNPNRYEWSMRHPIAKHMREHAEAILRFYSHDGQLRSQQWFDQQVHELSTYFGEDYGHCGVDDTLVTIAQTCFPQPQGLAKADTDPHSN